MVHRIMLMSGKENMKAIDNSCFGFSKCLILCILQGY